MARSVTRPRAVRVRPWTPRGRKLSSVANHLTISCRPFSRIRTECRWDYINHYRCLIIFVGPLLRAGARKPGGKCRWNYMVERVRKHEVVGSSPTRPATDDSSVKRRFTPTLLPSVFRASQNNFSECRRNYIDPEGPQAEKPGQRRPKCCGAEKRIGNCFRTFCH